MNYAYQARDAGGAVRTGRLQAEDFGAAAAALRRDGLFPIDIHPAAESAGAKPAAAGGGSGGGFTLPGTGGRRMKPGAVAQFATQLSVMAEAGVPLGQALRNLAEQSSDRGAQAILPAVAAAVDAGERFSAALAKFPKTFDPTFINLVRAGEESGSVPEMLARVAVRLDADLQTRRKLVGAMVYPTAMLLLCLGSCVFLIAFIFPKILPLFEGRDLELPAATKVLIFVSDQATAFGLYYAIGAAAALAGGWYFRSTPAGRAVIHRAVLSVPVVGGLTRKVSLARSLKTLAVTVAAGVPMLDSLKLAAAVAGNVHFARGWAAAADKVAEGTPVHKALAEDKLFPATLCQMVASGEQTGRLGVVLDKVGGHFEKEVEAALASAMRLIEPLMTVVMGGVIGTIALAMLLRIFKLSGGVG